MDKQTENEGKISMQLDEIKRLLQHLIAIQLYCGGATQDEIVSNLRIAKATVNKMVKGIKKDREQA
jgi:DNA-binding transcriptional regulator LsrR (DeoR family)